VNIWRERLARWFTPLARACPLSPNAITVVALGFNLLAAACLMAGSTRPVLFLAAIVLVAIGGLADAFDGIVARAQNKQSRFGDFLDHVADRISDTVIGAAWMMGNDVREPILVTAVILIMLNGYIGTQTEATYGHRSYDEVGRGEFVIALIILPVVSYTLYSEGWNTLRFGGATVAEWLAVALIAFAILGVIQRIISARRRDQA
jgi:phosphatidylglycerophosphate synthase